MFEWRKLKAYHKIKDHILIVIIKPNTLGNPAPGKVYQSL